MTDGLGETTALVTGAQGFIGCWLTERLLDEGAQVVAPVRDLEPASRFRREGIAPRCRLIRADVIDREAIVRALTEHRVRAVFHLAAQPIVGFANRSPHSTWESNIRGTYTVLEACRAARDAGAPIERIVVASSDHAYGSQPQLPYREEAALAARYPYDASKACADLIARSYASDLRAAGRGHADGEHLRWRRPELVADRPRHGSGAGRRPSAGDPLRRHPRARLPLRRRRGRRLPGDRPLARRSRLSRPGVERRPDAAGLGAGVGAAR